MAEFMILSNDSGKPFKGCECEICLDEKANLIDLPCEHRSCVECVRKIYVSYVSVQTK